jgi:hypothetical protein
MFRNSAVGLMNPSCAAIGCSSWIELLASEFSAVKTFPFCTYVNFLLTCLVKFLLAVFVQVRLLLWAFVRLGWPRKLAFCARWQRAHVSLWRSFPLSCCATSYFGCCANCRRQHAPTDTTPACQLTMQVACAHCLMPLCCLLSYYFASPCGFVRSSYCCLSCCQLAACISVHVRMCSLAPDLLALVVVRLRQSKIAFDANPCLGT